MSEYLDAAERYGRLAMKAQGNCRATLEALAKLHQPREQTVRHVHVNEGGQAVVADQFHHHLGASENGKSVKQSDATGAAGVCAALPRPDAQGDGLPVASRERQTTSRMHGGTNPGAPKGNQHGRKHDGRSAATIAAARYLKQISRLVGGV